MKHIRKFNEGLKDFFKPKEKKVEVNNPLPNFNIDKLVRYTEKLFQVIKQKVLKYQIITAIEYLKENINHLDLIKEHNRKGEISDADFKKYCDTFFSCLGHVKNVCDEEFIPNDELYKIFEDLIARDENPYKSAFSAQSNRNKRKY